MTRHHLALGIIIGILALAGAAEAGFRTGVVFYAPGSGTDHRTIAEKYELGIVGRDNGAHAAQVRDWNPVFRWYSYNSITDNYVSGPETDEHPLLEALAARDGIDVEEAYLHYAEDTVIELGGERITIPGWNGAADKADSRVPLYSSSLDRRATHFSTPAARELHLEVMISLFVEQPLADTDIHADGFFFDNSSNKFWNTGKIISGGAVREAGGLAVGSAEFHDWHWNENLGAYLRALHDRLADSAAWAPGSFRREIMINVANAWTDDFASGEVCDVIFMEHQYNPVRNRDIVQAAWDRDHAARENGVAIFTAAKPITSPGGGLPGTYSEAEAMLANLAWYLVTRSPDTIFFQSGTFNSSSSDFDERTWSPAMTTTFAALEDSDGPVTLFAEGTDPRGREYKVYARSYGEHLALVRPRLRSDEGVETSSAVTLELPGAFRPILSDGRVGNNTSTVGLRSGEGAVLLVAGTAPPPESGQVPEPPGDFALAVKVLASSPAAGAVDVPADAPVRLLLSATSPALGSPGAVSVSGSRSGPRTGSLRWEGTRVTFEPDAPWEPGESVRVELDLPGTGAHVLTFWVLP